VSIAEAGEFGLISRIVARLGTGQSTLLGPGDDAAVVAAPDKRVVASTDVLVEGRHFRRDWAGATDIGHRAAAANLADIAAMGAVPTALLVALCAPVDLDVAWAEDLAAGLSAEASSVGAGVVAVTCPRAPRSRSRSRLSETFKGGLRSYGRGRSPVMSSHSPVAPAMPRPDTRCCPAVSAPPRLSSRPIGGLPSRTGRVPRRLRPVRRR